MNQRGGSLRRWLLVPSIKRLLVAVRPAGARTIPRPAELTRACADGFDLAAQLDAERSRPRTAEPEDETPQEQIGPTNVGIGLRDRAGSDPDEDLVVLRDGSLDLFDPEDLRRPIAVLDHGFHACTVPPCRPQSRLVRGVTVDPMPNLLPIGRRSSSVR